MLGNEAKEGMLSRRGDCKDVTMGVGRKHWWGGVGAEDERLRESPVPPRSRVFRGRLYEYS